MSETTMEQDSIADAIAKRADSWCQPISGASACGEPARYDEAYEQLQQEVSKIGSVYGDACDWASVLTCADTLLKTKTKDMNVLGPLCLALLETEGPQGFAAGIQAYNRLYEAHSKEMYPLPGRKRGRAGAYTRFVQLLAASLEGLELAPEAHAPLVVALEHFTKLDDRVRQDLEMLHPATGGIKQSLAQMVEQTAPPPAPEPEPTPSPAPEPEPAASPAPEPESTPSPAPEPEPAASPAPEPESAPSPAPEPEPAPPSTSPEPSSEPVAAAESSLRIPEHIENTEQAELGFQQVIKGLTALARFHLDQDSRAALGYQLAVTAATLGVVPDGHRAVAAPGPRRLRELQQAVQEQRFSEAVKISVGLAVDGHLDLNTQALIAQALEGNGPGHESAAATLAGSAVSLFLTLQDLAGATTDTLTWLQGLPGLPQPPPPPQDAPEESAPSSESTPPEPSYSPIDALKSHAHREAESQSLAAGCAVLHRALEQSGRVDQRFDLRLAMAELCLEGQAPAVARPILQQLLTELKQPVEQWAPQRVVAVAEKLLICNRALQDGGDTSVALQEEAERLLDLLSQLNPGIACDQYFAPGGRRS